MTVILSGDFNRHHPMWEGNHIQPRSIEDASDLITFFQANCLQSCYSDAATNYPNVNYAPSTSPHPRFANMSHYLQSQDRPILFQICEWGIDFPALWAPALAHSWRIGNDIIPHWRSILRRLNQAVPQTHFAGPGQWPDLDMLLVDLDGVLSVPEEQTHFSLWAILKSPLVIGAAIGGMRAESLEILWNEDVIAFNQNAMGESASLNRRWSDAGYEVWSGPLEGDRVVAALINWSNKERELMLDLPEVGLQFAGGLSNIWRGEAENDVKTSYTASVEGHGVMLVELSETLPVGSIPVRYSPTQMGILFQTAVSGMLMGQAIDGVLPHLRRNIKPRIQP